MKEIKELEKKNNTLKKQVEDAKSIIQDLRMRIVIKEDNLMCDLFARIRKWQEAAHELDKYECNIIE